METLPTFVYLALLTLFLIRNRGRFIVQVYCLIAASYLHIFPTINYLLEPTPGYLFFQALIIVCFDLPLLAMLAAKRTTAPPIEKERASLSALFPLAALGMLTLFWQTVLTYDLLFLRLLQATDIPTIPRYLYRMTLETSFFVVLFLSAVLVVTDRKSTWYRLYQFTLFAYFTSFAVYFAINSRLQLFLLIVCALCLRPKITAISARSLKLGAVALLGVALIVGQTIVRELYLEDTARIDLYESAEAADSLLKLIATRLDSLAILYPLADSDFNFVAVHPSGLVFAFDLNTAFFLDPRTYNEMRESLVTSPSVEVINKLYDMQYVDFPKAMVVDVFLIFGIAGLFVEGLILGRAVAWIQGKARMRRFGFSFFLALYLMPMLFQFEKEALGVLVSMLKWSPVLVGAYVCRPRSRSLSVPAHTIAA